MSITERLLGPVCNDPIEWVLDSNGRAVGFKGLNGKVWGKPPMPFYGDLKHYTALSAVCCGLPSLNDDEQAIFDEIAPMIDDQFEREQDNQHDQLDTMDLGDNEWWHRKQIGFSNFEAQSLAYTIAETLVAQGWRKTHSQGA